MKKILYVIGLALSVSLFSCNEFLELTPESEYSVSGAYKTQNDFTQASAGIYSVQQGLFNSNASWYRGLIARSDDIDANTQYLDGLAQFTDNATTNWVSTTWNDHYEIINLSNLILEKIDAGDFNDPKVREYIRGEAHMFRGYAYWTLGWAFGGVPLLDKSLSIAEVRKVKRSTQEETFVFAAADYAKAAELLPETWAGTNSGRVTKFAAQGMLARLYMFQGKFAQAKPLLASVVNSGKYALEDKYRNAFDDGFDNGKERVWEVQFMGGLTGEGQWFTTGLLPEGFNDPSVMPFTGYSTAMNVNAELYGSYEKGDLRRDISALKGITRNGVRDTISVFVRKYSHYTYVPKTQQDWANNLPILRYTDVKMMYAEVLNEEGYMAGGEAFAILNEVRKRAGLPAKNAAELSSQDAFRQALRKERRIEFAFEGIRWLDLIRWGIVVETINKFLANPLQGEGRYKMEEHQKIFAIPFEEITRYDDASVLPQNPGY